MGAPWMPREEQRGPPNSSRTVALPALLWLLLLLLQDASRMLAGGPLVQEGL